MELLERFIWVGGGNRKKTLDIGIGLELDRRVKGEKGIRSRREEKRNEQNEQQRVRGGIA